MAYLPEYGKYLDRIPRKFVARAGIRGRRPLPLWSGWTPEGLSGPTSALVARPLEKLRRTFGSYHLEKASGSRRVRSAATHTGWSIAMELLA